MTEFITQDDLDRLLKSVYQNVSVVHGEPEPGYEITRCSPYPVQPNVDELTRGYEFTKTQLAELEHLRAENQKQVALIEQLASSLGSINRDTGLVYLMRHDQVDRMQEALVTFQKWKE